MTRRSGSADRLLRQPGGFEGLVGVQVLRDSQGLALMQLEDVEKPLSGGLVGP
jgi:hypothetical protein